MGKASRLRQAIYAEEITIMHAVFDGFSARLLGTWAMTLRSSPEAV